MKNIREGPYCQYHKRSGSACCSALVAGQRATFRFLMLADGYNRLIQGASDATYSAHRIQEYAPTYSQYTTKPHISANLTLEHRATHQCDFENVQFDEQPLALADFIAI